MGENSGLGDVLCSCLGGWLVSTPLAQGILFICASKFISFSMPAPKPSSKQHQFCLLLSKRPRVSGFILLPFSVILFTVSISFSFFLFIFLDTHLRWHPEPGAEEISMVLCHWPGLRRVQLSVYLLKADAWILSQGEFIRVP